MDTIPEVNSPVRSLDLIGESHLDSKNIHTYYHIAYAMHAAVTNNDAALKLNTIQYTRTYQAMKRLCRDNMNHNLRALLCKLLSLDPDERNMGGNPWLHFYNPYFKHDRLTHHPIDTSMYTYAKHPTLELDDDTMTEGKYDRFHTLIDRITLEKLPLLATQCMGCGIEEPRYKCGTCNTPFCGAKCKNCCK